MSRSDYRRPPFWKNGLPTPHCIEVFTQGDCWALAYRITEITPLRMYIVDGGRHWVAGDGKKFLDITGVSTRTKMLEDWDAASIILAPESDLKIAKFDIENGRFMYPVSLDRRRLYDAAERVVSAHSKRMGLVRA